MAERFTVSARIAPRGSTYRQRKGDNPMATKTKAALKAAAPTTPIPAGVKYRCVMQQVVADVAAKEQWFTRAFVTRRAAGKGLTNVLAATREDLAAARTFFEAALPNLSGKAKQEVSKTLNKGWIDPALLVVYGEVTPKVAVANPATEPKAARTRSQNPRVLANRMVTARAKAIADRSQADA
jgi:hypothetical protein